MRAAGLARANAPDPPRAAATENQKTDNPRNPW